MKKTIYISGAALIFACCNNCIQRNRGFYTAPQHWSIKNHKSENQLLN